MSRVSVCVCVCVCVCMSRQMDTRDSKEKWCKIKFLRSIPFIPYHTVPYITHIVFGGIFLYWYFSVTFLMKNSYLFFLFYGTGTVHWNFCFWNFNRSLNFRLILVSYLPTYIYFFLFYSTVKVPVRDATLRTTLNCSVH